MLQRPGAIIAGKYRIEKPLAKGGVGTVWVARHTQLKHEVAVKFLDPRMAASPQVRARFEREARASAQLRTPHIVQVFDYGIEQDTPYLVMELLKGETLHQRLRREKRLGIVETHGILVQLGKGLRRAHDVGFVHRDLKPANLFLAQNDDDETLVKILDFGIAKETGSEVGESTRTGELVGSPHYMSPEQIRGEREVDARSDLWAIGVILYKAITGYLPFPGEVLTAVITKIVVDPIPPARQYLPDAPASLDAFFETALARDKNRRFQTVADLVRAFAEVAAETAGVSVQSLGPASLGSRGSLPSFPDMGGSIPGLSASGNFSVPPLPSVSHLGALTSGSYPGSSHPGVPATLPPATPPPRPSQPRPPTPRPRSSAPSIPGGAAVPDWLGSMPGGDIAPAGASASQPPSSQVPATVVSAGAAAAPASAAAPVSAAAPASVPAPASISSPGSVSSPGTLASPEVPAQAAAPRKTPWILVAAGLAVVLIGVAIGAFRLRSTPASDTPTEPPRSGAAGSATATRAPEPTASVTSTEPAPSATATAAPTATETASGAAEAAPTSKPRTGTGGKPRPPGGKKPVDTID